MSDFPPAVATRFAAQNVPVRTAWSRCSPSWGWCSAIRAIALRTARVTPTRARSDADAARRSRPPRPTARDSSRTRKSRSVSACAARSMSPRARACSRSSSISARRRRYAGPHVEHLARIAKCRVRQADRLVALDRRDIPLSAQRGPTLGTPAGVGEEVCEIPHALEVSHSHRATLEHNRPVIALATKAVQVRIRLLVDVVVARDVRLWVRSPRCFDPFENRAGRLVLQRGLVCFAGGAQSLRERPMRERHLACAELVPAARSLEQSRLLRRVTLGETHPSVSKRRARHQCLLWNRAATSPIRRRLSGLGRRCRPRSRSRLCLEERRPLQLGVRRQLLRGYPQGSLERVSYGDQQWLDLLGPGARERDQAEHPSPQGGCEQGSLCPLNVSLRRRIRPSSLKGQPISRLR